MSSKKEFDVALVQLREAINKGYDFDTEDLGLIDHIHASLLEKSKNDAAKIDVAFSWVDTISKVPKKNIAAWIVHYQMSVYYPYHIIAHILNQRQGFTDFPEKIQSAWKSLSVTYLDVIEMARTVWSPVNSDRIDIFFCLSLLCLSYSKVVDVQPISLIIEKEIEFIRECPEELQADNIAMISCKLESIESTLHACRLNNITANISSAKGKS